MTRDGIAARPGPARTRRDPTVDSSRAPASLEALRDPPAKARELLGHLLGAEICRLDRMTLGRDPEDWERWENLDVPSLRRAWKEELPALWTAFLADAAMSAPGRAFTFVDFLGGTGCSCVEDVLLQLMFHSAYHRGQVAAAVREPAVTDWRNGVRAGAVPPAPCG